MSRTTTPTIDLCGNEPESLGCADADQLTRSVLEAKITKLLQARAFFAASLKEFSEPPMRLPRQVRWHTSKAVEAIDEQIAVIQRLCDGAE